jgi:hypothetical protein
MFDLFPFANSRRVRLHVSPLVWNASDAMVDINAFGNIDAQSLASARNEDALGPEESS